MKIIKSFRLPEEVVNKLEQIAKHEKRTMANLVIKILSDFAENN